MKFKKLRVEQSYKKNIEKEWRSPIKPAVYLHLIRVNYNYLHSKLWTTTNILLMII
jgi:hypothetical protein